ncbi:MAG: ABC transporter permease [Bacteroidetes bacterium]|nr:ABC transporter permease [Bacteroidota bacterium]
MAALIRLELVKIFRKMRTYIGFGLIGALVPLVYWGLSFAGDDMINSMTRGLQQNFLFVGSLFNGWFVANMVMNSLFVHVPFLILLVAGDILAGEATSGTYRILLTRPPSRNTIFLVKTIGAVGYTYALVIFLAILSVGLGLLFFGHGDMLMLREDGIAIIAAGELWWRFLLSYFLAGWAMCVVASLGLLFSSFVENAIGPIVGSFAVIILFIILGNLPFEFFENLRPYLFTTYTDVWRKAFDQSVDLAAIGRDVLLLAVFFLLFLGVAWNIFRKKDILS